MRENWDDMIARLRSRAGAGAMARIAEQGEAASAPAAQALLREQLGGELTRLALRIGEARRRAGEKYPDADLLFFTPELLEQSSAHPVAVHRAQRFREAGVVLDLGCGAGGDLTRLALAGVQVTGMESDPLAAALARANLESVGVVAEVVTGRFPDQDPPPHDALFVDPARRLTGRRPQGSRRLYRPEDFSPSPDELRPWLARARTWAVKWGPGLDLGHEHLAAPNALLAGLAPEQYEVEVVSWNGGVREAVLWGGRAVRTSRTATALSGPPEGVKTHSFTGDHRAPPPSLRSPGVWIHEPDGSLLRAGLMNAYAAREGMGLLAGGIAYLTSDRPSASPLTRSWRRLDSFSWSRRHLAAALAAHGAGRVVVKTRGFPRTPEEVRRGLKLKGQREIVVFLHRAGDGHQVHLAEPLSRDGDDS